MSIDLFLSPFYRLKVQDQADTSVQHMVRALWKMASECRKGSCKTGGQKDSEARFICFITIHSEELSMVLVD